MSEIISRVFLIGVLLFYAGLVLAFLLWNLGRRLRGAGKRRARPAVVQHLGATRSFDRPYDAS